MTDEHTPRYSLDPDGTWRVTCTCGWATEQPTRRGAYWAQREHRGDT